MMTARISVALVLFVALFAATAQGQSLVSASAEGQSRGSDGLPYSPAYDENFAVEARKKIAELQRAIASEPQGPLAGPLRKLEDYYQWVHTAHLTARDTAQDGRELLAEYRQTGEAPTARRMFRYERLVADFKYQWSGATHAAAAFQKEAVVACFTGEAFDRACMDTLASEALVFAHHDEHLGALGQQVEVGIRGLAEAGVAAALRMGMAGSRFQPAP